MVLGSCPKGKGRTIKYLRGVGKVPKKIRAQRKYGGEISFTTNLLKKNRASRCRCLNSIDDWINLVLAQFFGRLSPHGLSSLHTCSLSNARLS